MTNIKKYIFESFTSIDDMLSEIFKDINCPDEIKVNPMVVNEINKLETEEDIYLKQDISIEIDLDGDIESQLNEFVHNIYHKYELIRFIKTNKIIDDLVEELAEKEKECQIIRKIILDLSSQL